MKTPAPRAAAPRPLLTALAALAVLAACTDQTPTATPGEDGDLSRVESVRVLDWSASGLEQEVVVTPARVRVGDTVTVRSTVRNTGAKGQSLEARICGLDVEGEIALVAVDARCRGWSARRTLAPGEGFTVEDRRVHQGRVHQGQVDQGQLHQGQLPQGSGGAGARVQVRHLLDPDRWIQVELTPRD